MASRAVGSNLPTSSPRAGRVDLSTESLTSEGEPFGVRVRIVLPGSSGETGFHDAARINVRGSDEQIGGCLNRVALSVRPGLRA